MIYAGELIDGQLFNVTRTPIPENAFGREPIDAPKPAAPAAVPSPRNVHPKLDELVRSRPGHELAKVVIVFNEDVTIPQMPFLDGAQSHDSDENRARLAAIQAQVDAIRAKRAPRYEEKAQALNRDFGARVEERFWLINGVLAEVPVAAIEGISRRPDVAYIQPRDTGTLPASHNVSNGRMRINSDPYFNVAPTSGYIGLLDTGVRATHSLLSNPTHLRHVWDCTDGRCDSAGNPADVCNHGTSEAAILTGNGNMNDPYRGVTAITVDSFKVFPTTGDPNTNCKLPADIAVLGFEAAVTAGDRVIVTAMQNSETVRGAIATAADNAFDANRIVISIAGNYGPDSGSVRSPGLAHRVIAVGAEDVVTTNLESYSGRGPTTDGRTKPDIVAPTNTLTASNASDTATWGFAGTSGAVPYAAGAAMLVSNWYQQYGTLYAGHVYAALIAFGNNGAASLAYDNMKGAGRLVLPTDGYLAWGRAQLSDREYVDIPVSVLANRRSLDVAIWWAEGATQYHSNIDLALVNPSGSVVSNSLGVLGVFEKLNYDSTASLPVGTWKVRIRGTDVSAFIQQGVYWAFHQK